MTKSLALTDFVEVDGSDLSGDCRSFDVSDENNQVDVSGFNATGTDEFLLGTRAQSATGEFFVTDSTHDVLYTAYRNRTPVTLKHRKDQVAGVSSSNPELQGNVYVRNWSPVATRGDAHVASVDFIPSDSTGLVWSTT